MNSFRGDAWASFKAVFGPILTGAAFLLALLGPLYVPNAPVRIGIVWIAVAGLGALTVVLTMGNLVLLARRRAQEHLPKVIHASVPEPGDDTFPVRVTLVMEALISSALTFSSQSTIQRPLTWEAMRCSSGRSALAGLRTSNRTD